MKKDVAVLFTFSALLISPLLLTSCGGGGGGSSASNTEATLAVTIASINMETASGFTLDIDGLPIEGPSTTLAK